MLGVILAGGSGSRLAPYTNYFNKHIIAINGVPLIFRSLKFMKSMLGIKNIVMVLGDKNRDEIMQITQSVYPEAAFVAQKIPNGIASALGLAVAGRTIQHGVCLMLGDNLFLAGRRDFNLSLIKRSISAGRAVNVAIESFNPLIISSSGVIEINRKRIKKITEKPANYIPSALISAGLYFYPKSILRRIRKIKPSKRGEFEITDLNNLYLKTNQLDFVRFNGEWFDCGELDRIWNASVSIRIADEQN